MSHLIKMEYFDSLRTGKSRIIDSWPLMSSPGPVFGILIVYMLFITRIGPAWMKNREPFKLKSIIILYNAAQVILSVLVCYKCLSLNLFNKGILTAGCTYPGSTQDIALFDCGWWYFFAKVTELLDTVFFVLRKKQNQVSFLHVYHHTVMVVFSWSYLKFAAGGQGAVMGLLNSLVHVVMYTYYLLAALGPALEKYLWWKKYVTTMQLVQFIILLSYGIITQFSPSCSFPKTFTYFICGNIIVFFVLFMSFYRKAYTKKSKVTRNGIDHAKNGHLNGDDKKILNGNSLNDVGKKNYSSMNGESRYQNKKPYHRVVTSTYGEI